MPGTPQAGVPRDANNVPLPLTLAKKALAVTNSSSLSSALTVTLNANTYLIEVNALSQGIFMRWGAVPTSSAFDEFITAGATRHYVVPADQTSVQFIEQTAGATLICIEK